MKAATSNGAELKFQRGHNELVYKDGTTFATEEHGQLYYLNTVEQYDNTSDKVSVSHYVHTWHEILGHCNFEDVIKSQGVVDGMNISSSSDKSKFNCNACIEGKFVNNRNRGPEARATRPLEMVHTDLAGPIDPVSKEGFKYSIVFTDDFSGAIFVYFLKNKSDTVQATEKFLVDCSPYGQVKCMRSDTGTEFTSDAFQTLLREISIKHETSSPYSPHQNSTAERHWQALFETGRCLLIEKQLPKSMWPYAIQTAAHIRNRCYNTRIRNTPYFMLTGRKPNLSKIGVFGSECYAYNHDHKKLDSRCTKGMFVGYDENSPSYLVYHPDNGKVMKHRLIRLIGKDSVEQQRQTDLPYEDSDVCRLPVNGAETANPDCKVDTNTPTGKDQNERVHIPNSEANTDDPDGKDENKRIEVTHENDEQVASNAVQARSTL